MPSMEDRRVLDLPLERAWKIGKNSFEILPQLMPEYFESIDLEEGDGGPGSVFVLTMGPAMPGGRGRVVRERVDMRDDDRHKLKHTTIEGGDPRYSSFSSSIKYESGPYRNTTIRTWTAKYTPAPGVWAPPPEDLKGLSEKITETLHNYAAENPDYCAY
ncbi:pathogenesis-related protein 2 [Physcomitrium patens]|uniref:Bet v I/Major latex protein domain-containing protein n=1 Tax=Physcomitrium patens TaxID=3218 RepID=A0A2K1J3H8_PHYPA|nr:pathogenesis-related protein 2-like [Physcomitrium patens]PNR36085.1 hypothetical protein PHYPA_021935 [Physcomitrium patens]|eukprot:XP_024400244.1 pathogenesis-related protein 2-like [Physcomitrella patens]